MMRRLRVLAEHPRLGRPNDVLPEFEGAQAYIDVGVAEWLDESTPVEVVERAVPVETTVLDEPMETAVTRPSARHRSRNRAEQVRRA